MIVIQMGKNVIIDHKIWVLSQFIMAPVISAAILELKNLKKIINTVAIAFPLQTVGASDFSVAQVLQVSNTFIAIAAVLAGMSTTLVLFILIGIVSQPHKSYQRFLKVSYHGKHHI